MSRRTHRAILACLSTLIGLLAIAWVMSRQPRTGTVELVDTTTDLVQYFERRSRVGGEVFAAEKTSANSRRAPILVGKFDYSEVPMQLARRMFPTIRHKNRRTKYDELTFYAGQPGFRNMMIKPIHPDGEFLMVNNSLGLRRESEVSPTRPDLRVLVTGDSHMEGVVPMPEHMTELAEGILSGERPGQSIEVLNAGVGGYSFFNYLGVAKKFESLAPDVFVVGVYGGNDFTGSLKCYRFFHRLPLGIPVPNEVRPEWKRLMDESIELFAQSMDQALKLHFQPRERELATAAVAEFVQEMHGICEEIGAQLVVMYIPSLFEVQPQYDEERITKMLLALDATYDEFDEVGLLADAMLADAKSLGAECIDLRGPFRAAEVPLFWEADHHLNTAGHALAARELARTVAQLDLE